MYVSKLRGGVLIKFEKLVTCFHDIVGDPVAIKEEGVIPLRSDKATNKLN